MNAQLLKLSVFCQSIPRLTSYYQFGKKKELCQPTISFKLQIMYRNSLRNQRRHAPSYVARILSIRSRHRILSHKKASSIHLKSRRNSLLALLSNSLLFLPSFSWTKSAACSKTVVKTDVEFQSGLIHKTTLSPYLVLRRICKQIALGSLIRINRNNRNVFLLSLPEPRKASEKKITSKQPTTNFVSSIVFVPEVNNYANWREDRLFMTQPAQCRALLSQTILLHTWASSLNLSPPCVNKEWYVIL